MPEILEYTCENGEVFYSDDLNDPLINRLLDVQIMALILIVEQGLLEKELRCS